MKKRLGVIFFVFFVLVVDVFGSDSETMVVEANVFEYVAPEPVVSIEVPDYIFLGDVTVGHATNKTKIYVNNTGTVNVTITPQLKDPSEDIFSYLYFERRVADSWEQIGDFSFGINASTTGGKKNDYFYMILDLTAFEGTIDGDMLNHKADVVFNAMSV